MPESTSLGWNRRGIDVGVDAVQPVGVPAMF